MVVDDEPMIRETLKLFLQNLGMSKVITADCGENALKELGKSEYDYVFIDLMMPGINGIEALQRIRKSHQLTSVILMTGYPSMDIVIDAMHNGASDFLVKPFRFQDIKIILERIQRYHSLLKKNWTLKQELKGKKNVEELNIKLERQIRLQTILYGIIDSLSRINRSEELYNYLIKCAIDSCGAQKACFMIYDQGNSRFLVLAQYGLEKLIDDLRIGLQIGSASLDSNFLDLYFGKHLELNFPLSECVRLNDLIAIPFNIRNEPFGILLVSGKDDKSSFDKEDEFILKFLAEKAALNIENMALYDNLRQSLMASFMSLVSAIEAKDPYTQQHSSRVTDLAVQIAAKMGCVPEDLQRLESISPLHDIGKIGINDSILNKPGRLTSEEFETIKSHPLIGVNIVSPLGLDSEEIAIIRNHHERWDGKGYPDGLRGMDIPLLSRILAVADSYDAMISNRAYREALPYAACINELKQNSGSQFDPQIVNVALSVFEN
jgi:putative nucleotidyltransferase with HDIG domain